MGGLMFPFKFFGVAGHPQHPQWLQHWHQQQGRSIEVIGSGGCEACWYTLIALWVDGGHWGS